MSNQTLRISQLPVTVNLSENSVLPVVNDPSDGTYKTTVGTLRDTLFFEGAYSTLAAGLAATKPNETFFAFTDDSQIAVLGWVNNGGGSCYPLELPSGEQVRYAGINTYRNLDYIVAGVRSFNDLRSLPVQFEGQRIRLVGYNVDYPVGGGEFVGKMSPGSDDGGLIASAGNTHWERVLTHYNFIDLYYWGITPGTDISDAVIAAVAAAKSLNIGQICFPATPYNLPFIISKQIIIDYTDGKFIFLSGSVSSKIGTTILSKVGDGATFVFSRNNPTSAYFWTTGGIENLTINADPTIQTSATATAIQVSDTWGFIVQKVRIINFKYGNGVIFKNLTAWTEGSKIIDVDIRNTQIGLLFTRDTSTGSTATNSFMGTVIDQYSFQAGTGIAGTTGIQIGDDATVAATLECKFYASEITMRYWAEGGGFNFGVRIRSYSGIGDSIVNVIPDGIGLSFDQVVTATPYKSIAVEVNGYYNAKTTVLPYQGHLNVIKLSYISFALESAFTYDRSATTNVTLYKGFPLVHPRGLVVKGYEELTVAQQTAGVSIGVFNLPVGCVMRVTLRYYNSLLPANIQVTSYLVRVNGSGLFTTVAPENRDVLNVLTTSSATVSGTSVLTAATIADSRPHLNDFIDSTTAFKPRVANGNTAQVNKDGLGSDTRNFKIVVPANSGATDILCLSAELEFL